MLTNYMIDQNLDQAPNLDPSTGTRLEFGRVISAAIVNADFCERLLDNPLKALNLGYNGQQFYFSKEELRLLGAINAEDLKDFAAKLLQIDNLNTPAMHELEPITIFQE